MPLDTDLNVAPYYDDFDENKNFHRVLFTPGVAVQARELTQLQSILQNQIERFGSNIFRTGTIVKGCSLSKRYYDFIKLRDTQIDGFTVNVLNYANTLVINETSNLHAFVLYQASGLESQSPNLNTLYVRYINTGTGGERKFAQTQVVKVFNRERTVEKVSVVSGGTLYSNSDTVIFTGGSGTGARATLTTYGNGTVQFVTLTNNGTGYTTSPNVSITTSTGTGASLSSQNYIAEVSIANTSQDANATGQGMLFDVTDGVIFQKGFFVRVDEQRAIVDRYSIFANNISVGFTTAESVVNSSVDTTLLDNAAGSPNFNAPGAHRLKLAATLIAVNTDIAEANADFLSLVDIDLGNVVRDRSKTQFNSVNSELKLRTSEESGDYVLSTIAIGTSERTGNSTYFDITVDPGTAYVGGERVSVLGRTRTPTRKSTDTITLNNQNFNTSYGNYVLVSELRGRFDITSNTDINLYNTAATDITLDAAGTPAPAGANIGTAKVRAVEFVSGTAGTPSARYRVYLFNIVMSKGYKFSQVRSVFQSSPAAVADVVLSSGIATLNDIDIDGLVFDTGIPAVKAITNTNYRFKTKTDATLSIVGDSTFLAPSINNASFPYSTGAPLSDSVKQNIIIVPHSTVRHVANLAGSITTTSSSNVVTGSSTSFTTELQVGDFVVIGNSGSFSVPFQITSIANNTQLTIGNNFPTSLTANQAAISYPRETPIDFTKDSRVITASNTTSISISLGATINVSTQFTAYHDVEVEPPTAVSKTKKDTIYVRISSSQMNTETMRQGPWCLGVPDAFKLDEVYVTSSNNWSNTSVNKTSFFDLVTGQRDNYYGLSYIKLKKPLTLASNSGLIVKFKAFTHGTGQYKSYQSYPVSNTNVANATHIAIQDIPVFISPVNGKVFSLRNSIDFRPIVTATSNVNANTITSSGNIDPAKTESFNNAVKFYPAPDIPFEGDVETYISRIDKVMFSSAGRLYVKEGDPDIRPSAPPADRDAMELGTVNVAPFPSLSAKEASDALRPDMQNRVSYQQTQRYTMKDISILDERIRKIEYYTLLNTLEMDAKSKSLPSESNNTVERFKNGFFVDPFDNYQISNLNDPAYSTVIDTTRGILLPSIKTTTISLKANTAASSNVTFKNDLVLLEYTDKVLSKQTVASKLRNLTQTSYRFIGRGFCEPNFDNGFDKTVNSNVQVDIDTTSPTLSLLSTLNNTPAIRNSQSSTVSTTQPSGYSTSTSGFITTETFSATTTSTTTSTTDKIVAPAVKSSTIETAGLLTDVRVDRFIKPQKVGIYFGGLIPNTRHYVFFDEQPVADYVYAAKEITVINSVNDFAPKYAKTDSNYRVITTNSRGDLFAVLEIPSQAFTTGEKTIMVQEFPLYNSYTGATSIGRTKFTAFSLSGAAQEIDFNIKSFDQTQAFFVDTTTDTKIDSSTSSWFRITDNTPPAIIPQPDFGINLPPSCGGGCGANDPLSQTFYVEKSQDSDTNFITKADLYFAKKDSTGLGAYTELRFASDSGYPTKRVLGGGYSFLQNSDINVSINGSVATTTTFNTPVAVSTDKFYSFITYPQAFSPEFQYWTSQIGEADVATPSKVSNFNSFKGTLFYSSSDSAYTAVQDEDMKITFYRADFNKTNGTVVFNNSDSEFLKLEEDSISGTFKGGELIAQLQNSYADVRLSSTSNNLVYSTNTSATSIFPVDSFVTVLYAANSTQSGTFYGNTLTAATGTIKTVGDAVTNASGSTTSFNTEFSRGDFVRIGNYVRVVEAVTDATSMRLDAALGADTSSSQIFKITKPIIEIARVTASNSSTITVNKPLQYNPNNYIISIQNAVVGKVISYDSDARELILDESTASSSSFRFKASNSTFLGTLTGDDSEARARVELLDQVSINDMSTNILARTYVGTGLKVNATFTLEDDTILTQKVVLREPTSINANQRAVVKSRSQELLDGSGKSLTFQFDFNTISSDVSPVVVSTPASISVSKFNINNDYTNENSAVSGNATTRYISKTITLADGLDAEDFRLFMTAYRPKGTELKVYAKILSASDDEDFEDKNWTELAMLTSSALYSSTNDTTDVKEYEFTFKQAPASTIIAGTVTTNSSASNTTITGFGTAFNTALTSNDIIKINYNSDGSNSEVIPVSTVTNATSIEVAFTPLYDTTGASIYFVDRPLEAFKNPTNGGIVRYFDTQGAYHDSYKYLALKIVMLSDNDSVVPRVYDYRSLCISI
jgi:hypothetical protein